LAVQFVALRTSALDAKSSLHTVSDVTKTVIYVFSGTLNPTHFTYSRQRPILHVPRPRPCISRLQNV